MADVVLLSHNDLDGVGSSLISAYVLRKSGLNIVDIKNVGNHEVDTTILTAINGAILSGKETAILVTDITPSESTAQLIDRVLKEHPNVKLRVLDHHKHALFLNKYDWATIEVERDGVLTSGTSLVTDFLYDEGYDIDHPVLEFNELVRRYDTWDWNRLGDQEPKRLNDLLYMIGHSQFSDMVNDTFDNGDSFKIEEEYELLLDIEDKRIERYVKRKAEELNTHLLRFTEDGDTYTTGIVIAEQYQSELGNKLAELFPTVDIIAMVDVAKTKVSLRTNKDDVDVSVIAKALGGGGHKSASGFPLTNESVLGWVSKALKSVEDEANVETV